MNPILLGLLREQRPFQWHVSGEWYRYDDEGLWRSAALQWYGLAVEDGFGVGITIGGKK